jgi:hypothetical protein
MSSGLGLTMNFATMLLTSHTTEGMSGGLGLIGLRQATGLSVGMATSGDLSQAFKTKRSRTCRTKWF